MQTLSRAVKRSGELGAPLPDPFRSFGAHDVKFRRGATSMIAGPPGAFKSILAINMSVAWARSGELGLYVSADSDQFTAGSRCASIITGDSKTKVDKTLRTGGYSAPLSTISDLHWEFRALSVEQLDHRLSAFETMYGRFPDFVVMDNLMNMVDNPDDHGKMLRMCRDLDEMARAAQCHTIILHHTQEAGGETEPQPIWLIQHKVNQFSRLTLTVNCAPGGHMMVATVKNTNGPADRTGRDYRDFMIDTSNYRIEEPEIQ